MNAQSAIKRVIYGLQATCFVGYSGKCIKIRLNISLLLSSIS